MLSPIQRTVSARLRIGDGVRVVLPRPEGGAGLVWEVVSNSDEVLKQLTPLYPTEGAPGPDPSGGTTVSFAVVDDGRSALRFVALRPSERSSETTDAYEIDVTAKP